MIQSGAFISLEHLNDSKSGALTSLGHLSASSEEGERVCKDFHYEILQDIDYLISVNQRRLK